ncbi:hypothetical protein T4E_12065 [Trichinella pseudospiralis]|uniref:Uncharacterized protein n=1 Tax=Trichinella pseudospiralis TaxID=6337 RepID=A0A0V0XFR1_TRIPS|nr:hypothetical protein T4E_12065 [Trichinella pseudospiralis]
MAKKPEYFPFFTCHLRQIEFLQAPSPQRSSTKRHRYLHTMEHLRPRLGRRNDLEKLLQPCTFPKMYWFGACLLYTSWEMCMVEAVFRGRCDAPTLA